MKLQVREPLHGLHPLHARQRWRDEIVSRAAHLPHVRGLIEKERTPERRRLHWTIDLEIPLLVRALLPQDAPFLELDERWDGAGPGCSWSLRSRGLPASAAAASGLLHFAEDGLHMEGELLVDLAQLPQVPGALAKSAGPALEQALGRQIEHGYRLLAGVIR